MPIAFTIKHWGPDGRGSGASVVVAHNRHAALGLLREHFDSNPEGYRQFQTMELLEVELLEDSHLGSYPVSTETPGVKLQYWYPPDEEVSRVVFLGYPVAQLADELDALQAIENDGRGVSCVRTVCLFLRRGDLQEAKSTVNNESDKIRSYPNIVAKLREIGFWYECRF